MASDLTAAHARATAYLDNAARLPTAVAPQHVAAMRAWGEVVLAFEALRDAQGGRVECTDEFNAALDAEVARYITWAHLLEVTP